jgi:hypothetical protein
MEQVHAKGHMLFHIFSFNQTNHGEYSLPKHIKIVTSFSMIMHEPFILFFLEQLVNSFLDGYNYLQTNMDTKGPQEGADVLSC